jgi:dynein heavy chain
MILVRHGLMIIGETLSGKTSAYKALSKTLSDLSELGLLNESKVN